MQSASIVFKPHRERMGFRTYGNRKKSRRACQSAQSCQKLCCLLSQALDLAITEGKQQSFLQDCVDVQTRLKLCCLHMSEGLFSHDTSHLAVTKYIGN